MGSAFHMLCPRNSGPLNSTVPMDFKLSGKVELFKRLFNPSELVSFSNHSSITKQKKMSSIVGI